MKPKSNLFVIVIIILLLCFLPACNNEPKESTVVRHGSVNNNEEPESDTPQPEGLEDAGGGEESPEETLTEEPTEPPEEPKIAPSAPLSSTGPWYVVANDEGMWAFNMDGSGMTIISADVIEGITLNRGVAKTGGRIAYLTAVDTYRNLTLHIINLGEGLDQKVIPLTTAETEPGEDVTADWEKFEALRALADVPSYAWSNDGSMLAFFGIIEGPTSDLYVYSPDKDTITRLTSGPSQGFRPFWSPDDKYILHTGASGFGTGAGYAIEGVWAAKFDGSEVLSFNPTGYSGDELFLGWRDNNTFLSYTWNAGNGPYNLRFTDIRTGEVEVIWQYPFTDAVFGSPEDPSVLVFIGKYASEGNPDGLEGLYQFSPPDYEPELILETEAYPSMSWCAAGFFIFHTDEGSYELHGSDLKGPYSYENYAVYSDEGYPLWYSREGLWVNVVGLDKQIISDPVGHAVWGANSQSIMFATRDVLYVATAPDWEPVIVAALFPVDGIVLVMP